MQCLTNQYQINGTCKNCTAPCEKCTSDTNCISCLVNPANQYYLTGTECKATCSNDSYPDIISLKCKKCIFPCATCTSSR